VKIRVNLAVSADTKVFQRSVALKSDTLDPAAIAAAIDQCRAKLLADLAKPAKPS